MARKTRATMALEKAGTAFELLEYDYDPDAASIGLHAAQAMGLPAHQVFKTLMVSVGDGVAVCVVPSDRELNLKALAAVAGRKSAAMLKPAEAERISGYVVGGISPLGQRKASPCFLDESALALPFIVVNGGQRGLQVKLAPKALVEALNARVARLTD